MSAGGLRSSPSADWSCPRAGPSALRWPRRAVSPVTGLSPALGRWKELPHRGAYQGPSLCMSHVTSCIGDPHPSWSSTHLPALERPGSGAATAPIATLKPQDPI